MFYASKRVGDSSIPDSNSCDNTASNKAVLAAFNAGSLKDGTECDVWDGSSCRHGKTTGIACIADGSKLVQGLLAITAIMVLVTLFYAYKFFTEVKTE